MENTEVKVDIYALVDELREEIEFSKNCPFSKNKSVDPDVAAEILDDIKNALDDTLKYAKEIEAERDKVLAEARAEADAIIKDAHKQAQEMISENSITKGAYDQSQKILEKTKQKSAEIKRNTYEYSNDIFADLESYYKDSLELLKENINRLNNKREK